MLPAHQLQGELAISVPRHRHPRATITAGRMGSGGLHTRHRRAAPVRAQCGTQPRPPKAPCEATAVKTAWAPTSPHLQRCDRGVDGPGAGDDGPPAAGEGTMLPAHQLQGELAISVPRHRHPRATITAGKGWGICRFTHTSQDHRRAAPVRAQRGTQPRHPKAPCAATAVKTACLRSLMQSLWSSQ